MTPPSIPTRIPPLRSNTSRAVKVSGPYGETGAVTP